MYGITATSSTSSNSDETEWEYEVPIVEVSNNNDTDTYVLSNISLQQQLLNEEVQNSSLFLPIDADANFNANADNNNNNKMVLSDEEFPHRSDITIKNNNYRKTSTFGRSRSEVAAVRDDDSSSSSSGSLYPKSPYAKKRRGPGVETNNSVLVQDDDINDNVFVHHESQCLSPTSVYSSNDWEPVTPPISRRVGQLPVQVAYNNANNEQYIPELRNSSNNNNSKDNKIRSMYRKTNGSVRINRKPIVSRLRSFSLIQSPLPKMPQLSLPKLRQRIRYIRLVAPKYQHQRLRQQQQQRLLIRANHPIKILWDVLTVIISLTNAYATHVAIGNRSIGQWHGWEQFCQIWFVIDILLNFVTEHQLSSEQDRVLTNCQAVWARYLTSWFVVDLLSLVPGEALFVKPIIDEQKKRGFLKKQIFRVRNITKFLYTVVTRRQIRSKHVSMFSTVAKHSKRAGIGGPRRLLYLMIKYIPKYILFIRKMKGLVALRVLRQFHWFQKLYKNLRNFLFPTKNNTVVTSNGNIVPTGTITSYNYTNESDDASTIPLLHKQTLIDDDTISLTCDSGDYDDEFDIVDTIATTGIGGTSTGTVVCVEDGIFLVPSLSTNACGAITTTLSAAASMATATTTTTTTTTSNLRRRINHRSTMSQVVIMGQGDNRTTWEIIDESSTNSSTRSIMDQQQQQQQQNLEQIDEDDFNGGYPY